VRAGIAAACLVLGACGEAPRSVVYDLVWECEISEVLQETPVIDVGMPAARR